jgi:hypothetical protein
LPYGALVVVASKGRENAEEASPLRRAQSAEESLRESQARKVRVRFHY